MAEIKGSNRSAPSQLASSKTTISGAVSAHEPVSSDQNDCPPPIQHLALPGARPTVPDRRLGFSDVLIEESSLELPRNSRGGLMLIGTGAYGEVRWFLTLKYGVKYWQGLAGVDNGHKLVGVGFA